VATCADVVAFDPQYLALTRHRDATGHDLGPGDHLFACRITPVQEGGIEVDLWVTAEPQWPVQEGLHLDVKALADAAHYRLGEPALTTQRHHQLIDLAGGDTREVGFHHDSSQGPSAGGHQP